MKEPVDHILRPKLPWRDGAAITECGYDASKVSVLTREQYYARRSEMGEQRAALFTCMTCANTCTRYATWDDDPRQALEREIAWEGTGRWRNKDRGERLRDELLSIAVLIEAHREEFQEFITATEQRRAWLEKKAAHARATPKQNETKGRGL